MFADGAVDGASKKLVLDEEEPDTSLVSSGDELEGTGVFSFSSTPWPRQSGHELRPLVSH